MTVPASSPVDDALDMLDWERIEIALTWIPSPYRDPVRKDLATVREALERLREERDAARVGHRVLLDAQNELIERAESAEAELERLRRHPDAWSQRAFDQQKQRAEAAEAENRRLREGLGEISAEASKGIRAENRLPFLTHIGVIAGTTLASDPEGHVRALLAWGEAEPDEGGEA